MFARILLCLLGAFFCHPPIWAQSVDDSVRVTVTMNSDGSKTVYQVDGGKRESVATTTNASGKKTGKIVYKLDGLGRYESGTVFGPDGTLRFKTAYKYDPAGRLTEEAQLGKDGALHHK
ncbi:MAG TPA: hypothetical protein VGF73_12455, partial [Chthoniobacterales bacterium]